MNAHRIRALKAVLRRRVTNITTRTACMAYPEELAASIERKAEAGARLLRSSQAGT